MDKRQKVLIVDDAEFNRAILKEILGETYNFLKSSMVFNWILYVIIGMLLSI